VVDGSGEVEDQGGVARLTVELPKVDKSVFEKPKFKNFKKKWWIRGWERLEEVESEQLAVEEEPIGNRDKSSKTIDKAPKETERS
jgi:hypothetical protein